MTADPSADPRATELMAIDDSALSALIGRFVDATRRASFASRGLAAAAAETVWTGGAADAFKGSIGKLPRQLDQVLNSYYGVRAALEAYQTEIDQLKLRWTRAVAAIEQAQGAYQTASATLSADTRSLEQVLTAQARGADVSTRQVLALSADVARATAQLRRVSPGYEQARSRGMSVLSDFDGARSTLCSAIDTAAHHSIRAGSFLGDPQTMGTGSGSEPVRVAHHGHSGGGGGVPLTATGGSGAGRGSTVPATIREKLVRMERYVKSVMGTQYVYGGGHASFNPNGGLDCSGFVSGVLHAAGYLSAPQTTSTLPGQPGIADGHGRYVTIYDRTDCPLGDQHVIIDINGQFYEEGGISTGGAPDVHRFTPSPEYLASFNQILHPTGM
jgi:cell wall-associated NlpC family hydrolase